MSWDDFFALDKKGWKELFAFTDKELADLEYAKTDMPRLAFIAEQLQNEGFQIIPINSTDYPVVLKENLKIKVLRLSFTSKAERDCFKRTR